MNDIKYVYKTENCDFELVYNFNKDFKESYPVQSARDVMKLEFKEIENFDASILSYPLPVIKIKKKDKAKDYLEKIKCTWDNGYNDFLSDIQGKFNSSYTFEDDSFYYLFLLNSNFKIEDEENLAVLVENLSVSNYLGIFDVDQNKADEIYELDQNLQSAMSVDLILELFKENSDMKKYIPFISKNVSDSDLKNAFFFDEYVYELFMKAYVKSLDQISAFKQNPYGIKGLYNFINYAMLGVVHDECKCCSL